jgi:hypothetical protein
MKINETFITNTAFRYLGEVQAFLAKGNNLQHILALTHEVQI